MPRIPNREVDDDFDDYEDFSIDDDDPRDRLGRKMPREEREREAQRRENMWRKRHRTDD